MPSIARFNAAVHSFRRLPIPRPDICAARSDASRREVMNGRRRADELIQVAKGQTTGRCGPEKQIA
jgi:hypothetical protein